MTAVPREVVGNDFFDVTKHLWLWRPVESVKFPTGPENPFKVHSMRLTPLYSARESLMAEGEALSSVADNLANLNTVGFKGTRPEFESLIAGNLGGLYDTPSTQAGNGTGVQEMRTLHNKQGSLEVTDRGLDLAIEGQGYFVAQDGANNRFYTRAGNFDTDALGNLVTGTGEQILGFTAASPTTLVPLNIAATTGAASPTTTGSLTGNLDASSPLTTVPAGATTFQDLNAASSFSSSVRVIDSLGQGHDVALHFFHTANLQWTVQAYVDSGETSTTAGTPVQVGSGTINFDATGQQGVGVANNLAISAAWANGAAGSSVAMDLGKLSGFASPSVFSSVTSDGNFSGQVNGYAISEDGTISATLTNGQNVPIGTIALARFNNPDGLERVGNNRFVQGDGTGDPAIGNPGTEGRGTVMGGRLESSTVDPASEFIDMIRYQRAYQAGSQVITTVSELLNTTIQLA